MSLSVFREMENLTADEVSITIVANHPRRDMLPIIGLQVSARGKSRRAALADLELFDHRKGVMNYQGAILLAMTGKRRFQHSKTASSQMNRLRKALKKCIGIIDDPFYKHRTISGYEPRFKLIDKRDAADKRAKWIGERFVYPLIEGMLPDPTRPYYVTNDAAGEWLGLNEPSISERSK